VDPLPDLPGYAAVTILSGKTNDLLPDLALIDVVNGNRKQLAKSPVVQPEFVVDPKGRPLFVGGTQDGFYQLHQRVGRHWRLIHDERQSKEELRPLHRAKSGKLYVHRLPLNGPGQIELFDPATGNATVLFRPKHAEPTNVLPNAAKDALTGVVSADGSYRLELFDESTREAKALSSLSRNFADALVMPLGYSRDGSTMLFHVGSDRNSGEYYILDQKEARFLLARDPGLDPEKMLPVKPISVKARDGLLIHGYLTLPAGTGKAPLIVMPHGGPHYVRDLPDFNGDVQYLASRGFAVLQINFRGSGGYGQAFQAAGYREWGGAMIDDLIDATRDIVAKGQVDSERICAFGASYGGYAAMMMAIREPDLLRCVVSYVGVSDLELMLTTGDVRESFRGRDAIEAILGTDRDNLASFSPVNFAHKIKAKVMLVHGGSDQRVPPIHATRMRDALANAGNTAEWLFKPNEGHGFYRIAHRKELLTKLTEFLRTHTTPHQDGEI
jgi:dipeptidyl aminopeptidase/acylaminoacyl peptidase